jgi:V8-like Glu-specific endopeptidase
VIAGWGTDGVNGGGSTLRAGTLTVSRVTDAYIEADYSATASSICAGDSGGPLLISNGGSWAVAGVTSSVTSGCLSGTGNYANVFNSNIRSFILKYVPGAVER